MGLKEPRKTTPRSASNNTGRTPANNKDRNAHPTRTSATGEGNSRGKRERSREGVNSSKSVRKDNRQSPSLSVSALFNPLRHRKEVPQVPPGMYSVRQFQNNLAKAIIAKDVKRFQRLLRKYRKCCHSGGVMEHTGELVTSEEKPVNGDALAHSVLPDSSRSIVDRVVHFSTGYTMTHLAVVSWIHEFVDSCLEYGSAVHSYEDLNGDTALSLAISVQPELAFRMLQLGRDINIARVDIRGQNLLHNAVAVNTETSKWPGRIEFVKELLRRDPSLVLLKDPFGFTPAMWAAEHATQFASKEEYENIMNLLKTAEKAASLKRGRLSKEGNTKKDIGESEIKDESEVIKIDLSDEMSDSKESQDKHIMHVETRLSDSVRFFLEGPVTRLLCILLLLILHILEYAIDVADRGIEAQYRDAQFPFWFTIFNNIISCWVGSAFFMGLTHLACLAGAALIFAYLYYYAIHILLGKIVLRLPICGAISEAEEDFVQRSFGGYYLGFYKLSDRGGYFAKFIGALIGIFAGAKVYNILLHRFWPGQVWWAVIKSTITGLDAITALVGFWVVTLLLDWYIFTFVIDLLYQQGSLNVYLPHHTFGGFAETINKVLRWRKEIPLEKDIYGIRMTLYWSSLLAGWLIIILVFVLLEIYRGPAREVFLYPIIKTNWLGTPVIFASLSICLECIIAAQEWTWPTFQKHPFLEFPGLVITTHHAFFLMLLLLFLFSLDLRFIGAHIDLMRQQPGGIKTEDALLLALELIPAALGVIFIIILILRTSLWWGKCTIFGRNIELYAEHMRLLPCPLQSEKAALLAKEADTQKSSRFSRSLVNRGTRKNLKERSKIRKAVRNVEKQMQPTPANADTVQKKDKKKEEEEEQQQQQQQRQGLQPGVEDASASATPRLSLLWDRMFSGNRNSNSQSDISLVSQDEEMPESQEQK
ncbi:hypothetical protein LSM04_003017 [Trypanosoma melophagium]|uniref:uncharacterized protein n=1 Tax=Trypanosoma melophagium TaxID=715481 RepID=UPI00351A9AF8|nr:hypothetical protein LSM04_003017 [Trypanosoma melophagium]